MALYRYVGRRTSRERALHRTVMLEDDWNVIEIKYGGSPRVRTSAPLPPENPAPLSRTPDSKHML
jgi:hypothetical protein